MSSGNELLVKGRVLFKFCTRPRVRRVGRVLYVWRVGRIRNVRLDDHTLRRDQFRELALLVPIGGVEEGVQLRLVPLKGFCLKL